MTAPSRRTRTAWTIAVVALLVVALVGGASAQLAEEPDFETFGALPWEVPTGAMPFLVWEVVDGDTLRVIEVSDRNAPRPWWEPVRVIGIDTPERDGPFTEEECFGQDATAFVANLLPRGTTVYLQVDNDPDIPDGVELTDDGMELDSNDRWLMHVYLRDADSDDYYLLSEILALGGYAEVPGYSGNTYFVDELAKAEAIAQEENRGLWGACAA
jgi:endonuclease YncB( thermonuclease family)